MGDKKISVLMGIYNCESTLAESLDSLFAQTYTSFEIILCDDGSSDGTYRLAKDYADRYPDKIKLIRNEKNMGLNHTLNRCLAEASGEYIARMDGDDISLPERFEKEIAFLENHPEYAIVSTEMEYFDEGGIWGRSSMKERPEPKDFLSGTPFCHAPCMVRAEAFRIVGGYSEDARTLRAEDYHLWFRMYEAGLRGVNLSEPLYRMRDDENAYKRRKFKYALNESYVRFVGYKMLKLPLYSYVYALRPVLVSLLPGSVYRYLHHKKKKHT